MTTLHEVLERHVEAGSVPGAVGLVARRDHVEVAAVGSVDQEGSRPMTRDSIFRIASLTKPITAAAVMILLEDGRVALDDPVDRWLPELGSPTVVRTPRSDLADVSPARRPITVFDLLTFRAGWGYPSDGDFARPAVRPLVDALKQGPPRPQSVAPPDEWMATLSRIPLLHQPGDAWLYNTCSDILGVLVARASGRTLPQFLAERLFEPLGMVDSGFDVPADRLGRFTSYYRPKPTGGLELVDRPDGQWSRPPAFPSAGGGLVSTVDDWYAFARMLLAGGTFAGRRVLSPESVRQMMTDHLTAQQRDAAGGFLDGQGWGFGGSVDVVVREPWNVLGRYGWVGGTGTAGYVTPSAGSVAILLTQVELPGPAVQVMADCLRYAAEVLIG